MKIKSGGALSNLNIQKTPKLQEIRIGYDSGRTFGLVLNGDCLSYLTIDELLDLRDECNEALQKVMSVKNTDV